MAADGGNEQAANGGGVGVSICALPKLEILPFILGCASLLFLLREAIFVKCTESVKLFGFFGIFYVIV